jgi:hypothetical protein
MTAVFAARSAMIMKEKLALKSGMGSISEFVDREGL